ncbi:MAG: energy transducer TonB [Bacteroidota bacterium]|nr:energy transducer TonB [Bacteroidota bacterium]
MEPKKSPKADLEGKRKFFFELGLILSIAICLYGFESTTKKNQLISLGTLDKNAAVEELTPLVRLEEVKPIIPPLPRVADLIRIVENDTELDEELDIKDSGGDNYTAIYAEPQLFASKEIETDETTIFYAAEEMPEFPGGYQALLNFLSQNIRYPSIAAESGITGKVTVNFVVNKDGSISDATILRGVDQALDKEALRVINSLPKWKPGKQAGKPVRVSFSVPINFKLQ